jgi:hypothetical protein
MSIGAGSDRFLEQLPSFRAVSPDISFPRSIPLDAHVLAAIEAVAMNLTRQH